MALETLFENIGKLASRPTREQVGAMLRFAGTPNVKPSVWIGATISYALVFSFIIAGVVFALRFRPFGISSLLSSLLFFLFALSLGIFLPALSLYYKVENRREKVERDLPDFLSLVASNLRAGMTPMMAIRTAARKEFEPLTSELIYLTNKSLGMGSFTEALLDLSSSIKSEVLERTMSLFATSIISGGNVPGILESSATEMRETQKLKARLLGGVNIYVIFILFTIMAGMPLLFAVSIKFVEMLGTLAVPEDGGMLVSPAPSISLQFLTQLSLLTLILTSVLASALIGVVRHGDELKGLRYAIPITICSLVAFFVFRFYILSFLIPSA